MVMALDTKLILLNSAIRICGEGSSSKDIEVMFETLVTIISDEWPKKPKAESVAVPLTPIDKIDVLLGNLPKKGD